jgi:myo-inositol-1(or 4)-monophosphatase
VTDWLGVCRASVSDIGRILDELPTRAEREPVVGDGLGGDETTAVDKAAEDAILARLRDLDVTVVSEEVGRLGSGQTVVVVDPIDGSLNAKRGIPFFSVSIAVADGERMGDVHFGYVYDFGTGEEWVARRGEGATVNGERVSVRPKDRIEILSFEATLTSLVARDAPRVAELAYRLRIMGSLALSLCHLA